MFFAFKVSSDVFKGSSKSHPVSANVDLVFSEGCLDADTVE